MMCTPYEPQTGQFELLTSGNANTPTSCWNFSFDLGIPKRLHFSYEGVVRATLTLESDETFDSAWSTPRWSPAGNFVAMAVKSPPKTPNLVGRYHLIHVFDISDPDSIPLPRVTLKSEFVETPNSWSELRATADGVAFMHLILLDYAGASRQLNVVRTMPIRMMHTPKFHGNILHAKSTERGYLGHGETDTVGFVRHGSSWHKPVFAQISP